jgi:hypothetical protein
VVKIWTTKNLVVVVVGFYWLWLLPYSQGLSELVCCFVSLQPNVGGNPGQVDVLFFVGKKNLYIYKSDPNVPAHVDSKIPVKDPQIFKWSL